MSNKGKYALKALVYLAAQEPGKLALAGEVAAARAIPAKFLEAILSELRHAGFIRSRKGPQGGYCLARPAVEIIVGKVLRAIDGPLAPISCASQSHYAPCADCNEETCEIRNVMIRVRQAICGVLDTCTLADLHVQAWLLSLPDEPCDP